MGRSDASEQKASKPAGHKTPQEPENGGTTTVGAAEPQNLESKVLKLGDSWGLSHSQLGLI